MSFSTARWKAVSKSCGFFTARGISRRYLKRATMKADPTKAYDQGDAAGSIQLNALRLKVAAKVENQVRKRH
jgi:hypothetical protein